MTEDLDQLPVQEFPSKDDGNVDDTECVKTDIRNNGNLSKEQQADLISIVSGGVSGYFLHPARTHKPGGVRD